MAASWVIVSQLLLLGQPGRLDEAIAATRARLVVAPTDAEAHAALGLLLEGGYDRSLRAHAPTADAQGARSAVVAAHTAALAVPAARSFAAQRLAALLLREGGGGSGDAAAARAAAEAAVELLAGAAAAEPSDHALAHALGSALASAGRAADAALAFRAALALKPTSAEAARCAAAAASEAGALADADALFVTALRNADAAARAADAVEADGGRDAEAAAATAARVWTDVGAHLRRIAEGGAGARGGAAAAAAAAEPLGARLGALAAFTAAERACTASAGGDAAAAERSHAAAQRARLLGASDARVTSLSVTYVTRLFDSEAVNFDEALVGDLRYRGPELLADAVARARAAHGLPRLRLPRDVGDGDGGSGGGGGGSGGGGGGGAVALASAEDDGAPPPSLRVLDLGCGTGLAGAWFRASARWLAGVDLSEGMIARARARRARDGAPLYDSLARGDAVGALLEGLRGRADLRVAAPARARDAAAGPHGDAAAVEAGGAAGAADAAAEGAAEAWDVVVAADVVGYVGELAPLFGAAARALRPGSGLLALTAERLDDAAADAADGGTGGAGGAGGGAGGGGGGGVAMLPSGRLGHSERYLRATAAAAGLVVALCERAVLRYNAQQPVDAVVLVLRRP